MVQKVDSMDFDLYPVTCEALSNGRTNLEVLDALIRGGAKIVQLREKELSDGNFFRLAKEFRRRTQRVSMTFIINDRLDICRAVKADGVHLGQDDFPVQEARLLMGPDAIIGVSTHNLEEALQAEADGASYINVGPIFETKTKKHSAPPVGLELFHEVKSKVNLPVTVMGGINLDNLDQVLEAGANRIAVVSAITGASNIVATVKAFRRMIRKAIE